MPAFAAPPRAGWAWLALLAAIVAGLHLVAIRNTMVADDFFFSAVLQDSSLADYLRFRYRAWTGRIAIEAVLALLVAHATAWKLCNAAMLVLFCHAAGRLALRDRAGFPNGLPALLALALFLLMSPGVLYESAWWRTGAINYLWPAATGLYGLLALTDRAHNTTPRRLACLLAAGFACQQEQFALLLLPVAGWLALSAHGAARSERRWDLAQWLFMLANAIFLFAAPGSRNRFRLEIGSHFPDYLALDVLDRAAIGVELMHTGMVEPSNLLAAVAAALALVLLLRSAAGLWIKVVFAVLLGYGLLVTAAYALLPDPLGLRAFFAPPAMGGGAASSLRAYVMHAWLSTTGIGLAIACSLVLARTQRELVSTVALFAIGLGTVFVLGFSPTAYASGSRIHFAAQVVLLVVTLRLHGVVRERLGPRFSTATLVVVAALALYRALRLLGAV